MKAGNNLPDLDDLSGTVGFELLGDGLAGEVESALQVALQGNAVFACGEDPLTIFRHALAASIRNIESHPRGKLFQTLLLNGPSVSAEDITGSLAKQLLSDAEIATAITFIYSHMINCFKGAVAELLAARPCLFLMNQLRLDSGLSGGAKLYVGDAVSVRRAETKSFLKGADLHILTAERSTNNLSRIVVAGVVEVKSYKQSQRHLRDQLDRHLQRVSRGLLVDNVYYSSDAITVGFGRKRQVARISVVPSDWRLSRAFRYDETQDGRHLQANVCEPPRKHDEIMQVADDEWRITLRWSAEALAKAAYEMTFWYMEKVGEIVFASSVPRGWERMSSADAGRNAVKEMLYHAILRCSSARDKQQAIALYNTYGFGYALGMNFTNAAGKREMLWSEDLDEILSFGKTKYGFKLR